MNKTWIIVIVMIILVIVVALILFRRDKTNYLQGASFQPIQAQKGSGFTNMLGQIGDEVALALIPGAGTAAAANSAAAGVTNALSGAGAT